MDTDITPPVAPETEAPMTGERLAKELGCHHTTVSRWRNGHRLPGVELLNELALVAEIPYDEIFTAWRNGPKEFSRFFRIRILGEFE